MSDACIHAANVLYLVSFLCRDMLWLRVMTCFGLVLGVIFFTTCSTPLYGPAGWHVVFLGINFYQIYRLIQVRRQMRLPTDRLVASESAVEDLSRDELVDLLTHELFGKVETNDDLRQAAHRKLDADEEVLKRMVLSNLSRSELTNLLARRMWKPIQRRFRRRRKPARPRAKTGRVPKTPSGKKTAAKV